MGSKPRVLYDTNVLLRRVQAGHPHQERVVSAFRRLEDEGAESVVATQNIAEFWAVATRPVEHNGLGLSTKEAKQEVDRILALFSLLDDSSESFHHWRDLVERYGVQGKPTHDARLVATMLANGVDRVLTFNGGDFTRFTEVQVETP